jgi:hypothetical protein
MRRLVPRFPGFLSKVLELAGAGLASAIGAFLLSQIVSKPAPTPPAPQMVQIAPADAAMLSIVRSDQAALLAELQKVVGPETGAIPTPAKPQMSAAAKAVTPPKLAKTTAQPVPLPREKAEAVRPVAASYKAAAVAEEPLPILPASAAAQAQLPPATPAPENGRFRVFSTLKQIPSWFVPDTDKLLGDAPRPPMPVGQLLSSAM